jgi:hypothetical protein
MCGTVLRSSSTCSFTVSGSASRGTRNSSASATARLVSG